MNLLLYIIQTYLVLKLGQASHKCNVIALTASTADYPPFGSCNSLTSTQPAECAMCYTGGPRQNGNGCYPDANDILLCRNECLPKKPHKVLASNQLDHNYDATATSTIVSLVYKVGDICTDVRNEDPIGTAKTCSHVTGTLHICKVTTPLGADYPNPSPGWSQEVGVPTNGITLHIDRAVSQEFKFKIQCSKHTSCSGNYYILKYSAPIHVVVCGPGVANINDNSITATKTVLVYDVSSLPVSSSDYFTYSSFSSNNSACPIIAVTVVQESVDAANTELTHSGNNIWRATATTVHDYKFRIKVTAKGTLGSDALTRFFGPYTYSVVCPNNALSTSGSVTNKVYNYVSSTAKVNVYDSNTIFANARATACPLTSCQVRQQTACTSALSAAPYSSHISMAFSSGTGTLQVVPNRPLGFGPYDVCFWCTNGAQDIKRTINIWQKMDCANAFSLLGSTFTLADDTFAFLATGVETINTNVFNQISNTAQMITDCGTSNTCILQQEGCTASYGDCNSGLANAGVSCYSNCGNSGGTCGYCGTGKCCRIGYSPSGDCILNEGVSFSHHKCVCTKASAAQRLSINIDTTGKILAPHSIDPGYVETLCVRCTNSQGSTITKDNWRVEQTINCAITMDIPPASILVIDQQFDFLNTATTKQLYASHSTMFANINAAICTPTTCSLQANTPSCNTAYSGRLTVVSGTGEVRAQQNVPMGYIETLCVKCQNNQNAKIFKQPWVVEQIMNCAIALDTSVATFANFKFAYLLYPAYKTLYNDVTAYFSNPYASKCGAINNCKLMQQGCLVAYTGHVKITQATGFIEAEEKYDPGYTDTLCVHCCNAGGGCTQKDNWVVQQTLNCANHAFTTATSLIGNNKFPYLNPPDRITLYSDSTKLFTNPNLALCGAFTNCDILARGCVVGYSGNLIINQSTGKITALENVDYGYVEYNCIKCENVWGDSIQTLTDWRVEQTYNCGQALALKPITTILDITYPYNNTIDKKVLSNDWTDFFYNKNNSFCGTVTSCAIRNSDCLTLPPYSGQLFPITNTGNLLAPQNIDAGYNETICVQCQNAHGSIVNFPDWFISQLSNCEISITSLKPPVDEVNFDLYYFYKDKKQNGIRYENIDLQPLYDRFITNAGHCPPVDWELFYNDSVTPLKSDNQFLLQNSLGEINDIQWRFSKYLGVSTEIYNSTYKVIMKNKQTYGPNQQQKSLILNFFISHCDYVYINFNKDLPKQMPEKNQYRLFQGENNYMYIHDYTNADPSFTKSYNAYYLFKNEDQINCPIINYKVEKIQDRFGVLWTTDEINKFCEISKNGTFTLKDFQDPQERLQIWISAKNIKNWSGISKIQSMEVTLVKPFVAPNTAPYFDGDKFKKKGKDEYVEDIYITAYLNATRYDYPDKNPDRKYFVYKFSEMVDDEGDETTMKVISGQNDSYIYYDKSANQLDFNKQDIPRDQQIGEMKLELSDSKGATSLVTLRFHYLWETELDKSGNKFIIADGHLEEIIWSQKQSQNKTLRANITEIDQYGLVTIMFSSNILNTMFNITEKKGYDSPRYLEEDSKNVSAQFDAENAYEKKSMNVSDLNSSFFEMYIIPADDRHLKVDNFPLYKLNFTWEVVYWKYNFLKIQLYFNDSYEISSGPEWDTYTFVLQKENKDIFYSKDIDSALDPDYYQLWHQVPPQSQRGSFWTDLVMFVGKMFKQLLKALFWVCLTVNLLFGGQIRHYFTLVRTLQIITHLPLLRIVVPTCVIYFLSFIVPISNWNIFEGTPLDGNTSYDYDPNALADSGVTAQIQLMGYKTHNSFKNLGSITIFWAFYFAKILVLILIKLQRITFGNQEKHEQIYRYFMKLLFFQEFFMIIMAEYIIVLVSGYLEYDHKSYQAKNQQETGGRLLRVLKESKESSFSFQVGPVSETFSAFCLVCCLIIVPISFLYLLSQNINMYQKHKFQTRYGSLYEGVELRSKWTAAFYIVYVLRRIILCTIAFSITDFPALQIIFIELLNMSILIYTGQNYPLIGNFRNRLECFNELSVCIITFHYVLFTDLVLNKQGQTDRDVQYKYGILQDLYTSYYIYANISVIIYFTAKAIFTIWQKLYKLCLTSTSCKSDQVMRIVKAFKKHRFRKKDANMIVHQQLSNVGIGEQIKKFTFQSGIFKLRKSLKITARFSFMQSKQPIAPQELEKRLDENGYEKLNLPMPTINELMDEFLEESDEFDYAISLPMIDSIFEAVIFQKEYQIGEFKVVKDHKFANFMDQIVSDEDSQENEIVDQCLEEDYHHFQMPQAIIDLPQIQVHLYVQIKIEKTKIFEQLTDDEEDELHQDVFIKVPKTEPSRPCNNQGKKNKPNFAVFMDQLKTSSPTQQDTNIKIKEISKRQDIGKKQKKPKINFGTFMDEFQSKPPKQQVDNTQDNTFEHNTLRMLQNSNQLDINTYVSKEIKQEVLDPQSFSNEHVDEPQETSNPKKSKINFAKFMDQFEDQQRSIIDTQDEQSVETLIHKSPSKKSILIQQDKEKKSSAPSKKVNFANFMDNFQK